MSYRDWPISKKALALGVIPAVCGLVLITAAMGVAVYRTLRANLTQSGLALVAVAEDNMRAPLGFNDPATADQLLNAFRAVDSVDRVCVFDTDARLFASFTRTGLSCPATDDGEVADPAFEFVRAVAVGSRRVGSVHLWTNTDRLVGHATTLSTVAFVTLVGVVLVVWRLAHRMQRAISEPIASLALTAGQVSATGDYSLRAERTTSDEIGRLVLAFNDMMAQVEKHDRAKDEFLATLSHELRTPLNAMLGWLQLIQKTKPTAPQLDRALSTIYRNARVQQRVVEDLLDISRIVAGKLQMSKSVVDLQLVLSAAIDVVNASSEQSNVAIVATLPSTPCLVSGDFTRLQQAFWNLLANAVKFTPAGGSVTVTIQETTSSYAIVVTDTGIGIDPEFLPRVFDRFQQEDGSVTREHGGLGLGLAIVREIVLLHNGHVTAHSLGTGAGATFTIELPRVAAREAHTVVDQLPRRRVTDSRAAAHS
jgi:signal transduction histidine kinase